MSRGGARPGAGRKRGPEKKMVTLYLRADLVEQLPKERSALVEELLDRWLKRQERAKSREKPCG